MQKQITVLVAIAIFISGCSLNSDGQVRGTVINGQDQLSDMRFKEGDILTKINQLNKGNMQLQNTSAQSGGQQDIELENLTEKYNQALIRTNFGDIKLELYTQESPLTVNNFLNLANKGFYNSTKFHRVIPSFMIQGGDPNSKDDDWSNDGTGGPGYSFQDEFNQHKLVRGSFAMANSGPNTNGSQFFIVTADSTPHLDGVHTNFGQVIEGMDIVAKIEGVNTNENDHPTDDVIIEDIQLLNSADTYELNAEEQEVVEEKNTEENTEESVPSPDEENVASSTEDGE